ncbi:MAG TPA: response regulator [Gemmatirosa sp.]
MTARRPAVLIVDDSPLVTDALGVLLEASGYTTGSATTVADAVTALRNERYDAMLLDLTLPDGDGLEVLGSAEEANLTPPPTLALTGHDDPATAARCREAGCVAVLVKPVRRIALLGALQAAGVAP